MILKKTRSAAPEASKKRSVVSYMAILFTSAVLLLVLAYFMQERALAHAAGELLSGM